jgi:hypothetical protein
LKRKTSATVISASPVKKARTSAVSSGLSVLGTHLDSFTAAFSSAATTIATGQAPGVLASPQRKQAAIKKLQALEKGLSAFERFDLVRIFSKVPTLADEYLAIDMDDLREVWIMNTLEEIASGVYK